MHRSVRLPFTTRRRIPLALVLYVTSCEQASACEQGSSCSIRGAQKQFCGDAKMRAYPSTLSPSHHRHSQHGLDEAPSLGGVCRLKEKESKVAAHRTGTNGKRSMLREDRRIGASAEVAAAIGEPLGIDIENTPRQRPPSEMP